MPNRALGTEYIRSIHERRLDEERQRWGDAVRYPLVLEELGGKWDTRTICYRIGAFRVVVWSSLEQKLPHVGKGFGGRAWVKPPELGGNLGSGSRITERGPSREVRRARIRSKRLLVAGGSHNERDTIRFCRQYGATEDYARFLSRQWVGQGALDAIGTKMDAQPPSGRTH